MTDSVAAPGTAADVGRPAPETVAAWGATNNIAAYFTHWVQRTPDRPAIVFPRQRGMGLDYDAVTFRELDVDANKLAPEEAAELIISRLEQAGLIGG